MRTFAVAGLATVAFAADKPKATEEQCKPLLKAIKDAEKLLADNTTCASDATTTACKTLSKGVADAKKAAADVGCGAETYSIVVAGAAIVASSLLI